MKKIFVTVKEFEDNGGVLENGRKVFDDELDENSDGVFECQQGNKIVCYFGGTADTIDKLDVYVQIDCQPIYK